MSMLAVLDARLGLALGRVDSPGKTLCGNAHAGQDIYPASDAHTRHTDFQVFGKETPTREPEPHNHLVDQDHPDIAGVAMDSGVRQPVPRRSGSSSSGKSEIHGTTLITPVALRVAIRVDDLSP